MTECKFWVNDPFHFVHRFHLFLLSLYPVLVARLFSQLVIVKSSRVSLLVIFVECLYSLFRN